MVNSLYFCVLFNQAKNLLSWMTFKFILWKESKILWSKRVWKALKDEIISADSTSTINQSRKKSNSEVKIKSLPKDGLNFWLFALIGRWRVKLNFSPATAQFNWGQVSAGPERERGRELRGILRFKSRDFNSWNLASNLCHLIGPASAQQISPLSCFTLFTPERDFSYWFWSEFVGVSCKIETFVKLESLNCLLTFC